MLYLLLQQLLGPGKLPIGRKHGENLQTYQAGGVAPDRAANIRSKAYYDAAVAKRGAPGGTGAAAGAAAAIGRRPGRMTGARGVPHG